MQPSNLRVKVELVDRAFVTGHGHHRQQLYLAALRGYHLHADASDRGATMATRRAAAILRHREGVKDFGKHFDLR